MNALYLVPLITLGAFLALFVFWIMWASVCALEQARDAGRLSPAVTRAGEAYAAVCLVYDVLCNLTLCTVIFLFLLDVPREATLSARLRRLVLTSGLKAKFATWLAVRLINPLRPPDAPHIRLPAR